MFRLVEILWKFLRHVGQKLYPYVPILHEITPN